MTVYDLKPAFQDLLRPLCRSMARSGITANQVTVLALVLSLLVGGLVWVTDAARWALLLIPAALFVRMALNAIDGMLAREHDMRTPLGGILNELGDVVSDSALYLPFAALPGISRMLLVLIVLFSVFTEMAGVVAVQVGARRRYDGPMGKSDRALVFGAIALLIGFGVPSGHWLDIVLCVVLALLVVTLVNRAREALKEAKA
ncbi:MAG: CDP-alcohol phosphatidyltransferase family protein [Lentisphaerae bacterium]|nr:CDP-alcohol phosphatidyltransferase family protein [Lentisphaerota bacterium]